MSADRNHCRSRRGKAFGRYRSNQTIPCISKCFAPPDICYPPVCYRREGRSIRAFVGRFNQKVSSRMLCPYEISCFRASEFRIHFTKSHRASIPRPKYSESWCSSIQAITLGRTVSDCLPSFPSAEAAFPRTNETSSVRD